MDRQLISRARDGVLDLRTPLTSQRTGLREGIAGARLETLRGFGLARPLFQDVWRLSDDLESELRRRGERGDIIKSMNRALAREGQARGPDAFVTHDQEQIPAIGRVIDKGLAGPTEERAALIVDGVDGKVRRVEMSLVAADAIPMRAIVQTGSGATVASTRPRRGYLRSTGVIDGRSEPSLQRLRPSRLSPSQAHHAWWPCRPRARNPSSPIPPRNPPTG
jgi:hypothetical protein